MVSHTLIQVISKVTDKIKVLMFLLIGIRTVRIFISSLVKHNKQNLLLMA